MIEVAKYDNTVAAYKMQCLVLSLSVKVLITSNETALQNPPKLLLLQRYLKTSWSSSISSSSSSTVVVVIAVVIVVVVVVVEPQHSTITNSV